MKVAVVGLGAMGMGIAKSSLRAGLDTVGFDVSEDKRSIFGRSAYCSGYESYSTGH